ncbi:MAG: zinc-dependent alcohol dehydrogenase family protein [Longimicrobiales bacterium]
MRAQVFEGRPGEIREVTLPEPQPGPGQLLLRVRACGVCRTDLHIVDGELAARGLPRVPGHQIVGDVVAAEGAEHFAVGDRIGVPWLGWTCGRCDHCVSGRENLCEAARFTGYDIDGGFAEMGVADARYCFRLPDGYADDQAAPLLCAGLIGYRALRLAGEARRIGFYGFGAAAHILAQVCHWQGQDVYAFTRAGDAAGQAFARELGAVWAGSAQDRPPEPLDAAILFAPAGELVPVALGVVRRGGRVDCAGIHMSDIPGFPYQLLWGERSIQSVANLTRRDAEAFLGLAPRIPVRTRVRRFALAEASSALAALRQGAIDGAAVLVP